MVHGVIIDDRFLIVKVKTQPLFTSMSKLWKTKQNRNEIGNFIIQNAFLFSQQLLRANFFTLINVEMSFCTFLPRNIYTARRWIVFLQFGYRCNITEMRIDTFANSENIYPMNNKFKGKCTNGISGDLHQPLQWQCIHTCNERLKIKVGIALRCFNWNW